MKIKNEIKDYLVAQELQGSNTKEQCKIVKKLRDKGETEILTEDCSIIREKDKDDCGWLIPNTMLE